MKRLSRHFFLTALPAVLIFLSCNKDKAGQEEYRQPETVSAETIGTTNSWLDKQKSGASLTGIERIQSLKESLDFSTSISEKLFMDQGIILVPLKNAFVTNNNNDRNPVNILVLFLNKDKEVSKGFIVQYISKKKFVSPKELVKFLYKYYKFDETGFTGSLAYLTVADEFSHEVSYENGVNKYYKSVGKKQTVGSGRTCFEVGFYYYWSDGSVTWEPIGSFCDGCEPVKMINGRAYRLECGSGGGGGGPEEPALTSEVGWEVYNEVVGGGGPNATINAKVQFWGKKIAGEPLGGHFTQSYDHGFTTFNFPYGMDFVSGYSQSWPGTQNAYQAVQGTVTYSTPGAADRYISKTKTFIFSEVFP